MHAPCHLCLCFCANNIFFNSLIERDTVRDVGIVAAVLPVLPSLKRRKAMGQDTRSLVNTCEHPL